jgi:hypothetical protein
MRTSWHDSTCASQDRLRLAPCDCQPDTARGWWAAFDEYAATSGLMPLDEEQLTIVYRARRAGLSPSAAIVALQALELTDAE